MRSERVPGRALAAVLLTAFALVLVGCGGGGNGNEIATLVFHAPAADVDVEVGAVVPVSYTDNDTDDAAETDLFADRDGNLSTTGDRFVIAINRPEGNGAVQNVNWDTTGVPLGTYHIIGVVDDGVNGLVEETCPVTVTLHGMWPLDHSNIILKDRWGNQLQANSSEPFSTRQTCGTCHDVTQMANGYHFQQGRTDDTGAVHTADDFFGDGREFLKSDGMYGKW